MTIRGESGRSIVGSNPAGATRTPVRALRVSVYPALPHHLRYLESRRLGGWARLRADPVGGPIRIVVGKAAPIDYSGVPFVVGGAVLLGLGVVVFQAWRTRAVDPRP